MSDMKNLSTTPAVHAIHPAEKPGILVKPGAEPVLKATNVTKWFGENHVLRGASITVWPGETVCILGRSGSGKSTFLRSLNFLEEPTDGRVEIDGVVVEADPFHTKGEARQAQIQQARFSRLRIHCNARMGPKQLQAFCRADTAGQELLKQVTDRLGLSARTYTRLLKVARTIADLAGSEDIEVKHLAEAIQYRQLDRDAVT